MSLIPQPQRGPIGPPGPAGGGLNLEGVLALGNQSGVYDIEMGVVGTQKTNLTNANVVDANIVEVFDRVQIGEPISSTPKLDFLMPPNGGGSINFLQSGPVLASIDFADVNKKITVNSQNISLDAGIAPADALVELTSAGVVNIDGNSVSIDATAGTVAINGTSGVSVEDLSVNADTISNGAVSIALTPSPASPAGVFIATGTGGRVEISQGDLFMNTNDIQDVSTLQTASITNNSGISPDININATGTGSVLIEGLSVNGTTITAPATNADIAFDMNGTGGLTVSNTSAVGGADPMLTLTNTSTVGGTTANPVKILTYKNDSNTTASDLIGEYTVRANGGGATSSTPYDYTSIRSFARGVGANNVDGSIALQVAENATPTSANLLTYVECNGGNARVEIKKNIDLTNQDLLNVKQIALGSLTAVGTAGQVITSRGTGGGTTTYSNPNQTPAVGNVVGGQSIDATTPNYNFGCGSSPSHTFIPVPNNRYRVDFSMSLEGPNTGLFCFPRVSYNSVDYFGDIYQDPALGGGNNPFVSQPTSKGGLHYHSINFTDYFTIPISASSGIGFAIGILTSSGSASVNTAKVCATISPCFD